MRSRVIDPADLNAVKGAPICFGASEPIREIRYLLDQMHNEFGFSEKAILASKRLFVKEWENGNQVIRLPKGKDRLFMALADSGGEPKIEEWAPDIRYQHPERHELSERGQRSQEPAEDHGLR